MKERKYVQSRVLGYFNKFIFFFILLTFFSLILFRMGHIPLNYAYIVIKCLLVLFLISSIIVLIRAFRYNIIHIAHVGLVRRNAKPAAILNFFTVLFFFLFVYTGEKIYINLILCMFIITLIFLILNKIFRKINGKNKR